jgi:WD40 repeat protein
VSQKDLIDATTAAPVESESRTATPTSDFVPVDPTRYELGAEVSQGGFGRVISARDVRLDRAGACALLAHDGPVRLARFFPDGRTLLTASDDKTVRVWDVASAAELQVLRAQRAIGGAVISPDSRFVVVAFDREPLLRIWSVDEARPERSARWLERLSAAALTPENEIASGLEAR